MAKGRIDTRGARMIIETSHDFRIGQVIRFRYVTRKGQRMTEVGKVEAIRQATGNPDNLLGSILVDFGKGQTRQRVVDRMGDIRLLTD